MEERINKNNLVSEIATETGLDESCVRSVINIFVEKIKSYLVKRITVSIKGFCTFSVKSVKARKFNDFEQKSSRIVGARDLPKAKFSNTFIDEIKK